MRISVIICCYSIERFVDILAAIDSIIDQTHPNREVVLVVDRNNELYDKLSSALTNSMVHIVFSKNAGLSEARNAGIVSASGDVIAFLDDDAVADKEWLKNLVINYDDPNIIGVGGNIKPLWVDDPPVWLPKELYWTIGCIYKGHPEEKTEIRNTFGSNISFKREIFDRIGGFNDKIGRIDEKSYTAEEMEFSSRALSLIPGSKIIYDPRAIVHHRIYTERQKLKNILKRAYGEGKSKAYVAKILKQKAIVNILSKENDYLIYLISESIPQYLGKTIRGKNIGRNLAKILILTLTASIVLGGYIRGRLRLSRGAI